MIAWALAALICIAEPVSAPVEILGEGAALQVPVGRSQLLRTKADIRRTAIAAEGIVELSQFTPREIALHGRAAGSTTVTFWFSDHAQPPLTYLIEVVSDRPSP